MSHLFVLLEKTFMMVIKEQLTQHRYTFLVAYVSIFYFAVPPNGLVVYCGTIVTEEGKEKKVNIDFEPFKPINTSLYLCDNKVSL